MSARSVIRNYFYVIFSLLVLLLYGCGGGSGAGQSVQAQAGGLVDPASSFTGVNSAAVVTSGNAEALALGGFFGTRTATKIGIIGSPGKSTTREAIIPVRELVQKLKLSARRLAIPQKAEQLRKRRAAARTGKFLERTSTYQVSGDTGGVATFSLDINDSAGTFYGSVNFQSFTSSGTVVNGSCDLLGSFDANRQETTQLTLSFKSLSMTQGSTYDLVGNISWTYAYSSSSDTMTMNMVLKDVAHSKTYWFNNYRVATTYGTNSLTQSLSGRYYDHDAGFVDIGTESQIEADYGASWPCQGTLVSSALGRWVKLTFLATTYKVQAETDGDGVMDWQQEMPSNTAPAVNNPPVAEAGADQNATVGSTVNLDGSSSSDPDGDTLSYYWSLDAAPPGAGYPALTGNNTATPSFTPTVAGDYQLTLRVYDGSAMSYDSVTVTVALMAPLHPAAFAKTWQFGNYGASIGEAGLLTADLDGDGVTEIIASASSGGFGDNVLWYVVKKNAGGGFEQVWRSENYGVTIVRILMADMNRDGRDDVVVALSDGTIHCYDGPTLSEIAGLKVAGSLRDLAIADLDGDGHREVVTTDGSAIRVYNAETGALKWSKSGYGGTSLAVGNVDTDPALEIVTTSYGGKGYVIDGISGAVKWEYINGFGAMVRLADVDGDGMKEIIGASSWYNITVFDADIKTPTWELHTDLDIGALLVTDIDGDGIPEIIYGDSQWGEVHAIDARSHQQRWQVSNPEHGVSGIGFADVDQDGKKELLWGAGGSSTGPDFLFIADPDTKTIKWQNKDYSGLSTLEIGDLNNDGSNQLLMITANSNSGYDGGMVHVFDAQSHLLSYQQPLGNMDWMGGSRAVRIGDVDGDGKNEFVITTGYAYDGFIQVNDGATRKMKRQSARYGGSFSGLVLADVDGDGKVEIVTGQGSYLIVFDGSTLQEKWKSVSLGGSQVYDVKVADLDKDGHQDIIATLGDTYGSNGRLAIFDGVNHILKLMIQSPARALEVADVDGIVVPDFRTIV